VRNALIRWFGPDDTIMYDSRVEKNGKLLAAGGKDGLLDEAESAEAR